MYVCVYINRHNITSSVHKRFHDMNAVPCFKRHAKWFHDAKVVPRAPWYGKWFHADAFIVEPCKWFHRTSGILYSTTPGEPPLPTLREGVGGGVL